MLAEMPSAPPILLLHVLLLYSGGALFLLGISKTFKQLPGVIMSVIGALLIFMSFMCFNIECAQSSPSASVFAKASSDKSSGFAEQKPKNPHPPTVEEMEQAALQLATKPVLHRMGGAGPGRRSLGVGGCLEGNGDEQATDQELDDILEKKWLEQQATESEKQKDKKQSNKEAPQKGGCHHK